MIFLFGIEASFTTATEDVVISTLDRRVDLRTSLMKETTKFVIQNDKTDTLKSFYLTIKEENWARLTYIMITDTSSNTLNYGRVENLEVSS